MGLQARYWPKGEITFAPEPHDEATRDLFRRACRLRYGLYPTEADVVYALARGVTAYADLAAVVHLSYSHTKNTLSAVHRKLGVPDRNASVVQLWPLYQRSKEHAR